MLWTCTVSTEVVISSALPLGIIEWRAIVTEIGRLGIEGFWSVGRIRRWS
jgi:hypothetical protein